MIEELIEYLKRGAESIEEKTMREFEEDLAEMLRWTDEQTNGGKND